MIIEKERGSYTSKILRIDDGIAVVLPDLNNFIFNSHKYTGNNTVMIRTPGQHTTAVAMAKGH